MQSGKIRRRNLLRLGATATLAFTALGAAACTPPAAVPTGVSSAPEPSPVGQTPPGEQKPVGDRQPTAEPWPTTTARPASANTMTTLQHWYHQYGEKGAAEAVLRYAREYEAANADVKIVVNWTSGNYNAKLAAALAGGQGPDVFEAVPGAAPIASGQCAALDDILGEMRLDFDEKGLAASTVGSRIYGIRMSDDTGVLYGRKSILVRAGVSVPTTFGELLVAATKLTAGKQKGLFLGNDGGVSALMTLGPISAGATLIDEFGPQFNTETTVFAFEQIARLNREGGLLVGAPTDWWDPSAFTQGLAAMQWSGFWAYPEIARLIGDDFVVAPFPSFEGVPGAKSAPVTFLSGWSQFANGESKSLDAAKALIKWMWIDNAEIQSDWALSYSFRVPPRLSVAMAAAPLRDGRARQIVEAVHRYGIANPPTWTSAMDAAMKAGLGNVVKSARSARGEVAAAFRVCEAEFAAQTSTRHTVE